MMMLMSRSHVDFFVFQVLFSEKEILDDYFFYSVFFWTATGSTPSTVPVPVSGKTAGQTDVTIVACCDCDIWNEGWLPPVNQAAFVFGLRW
jgi:hypothetical protein